MINKKLLTVLSVAATIATSSAFAKTEGSYVGVDLLATQYKDAVNSDRSRADNMGYGAGVNYKYAFNCDNFFIAPGVFYNYNNANVKSNSSDYQSKLRHSYGVKADLGYDINDKIATFVTFGYQENYIKDSMPSVGYRGNSTLESLIYGVGAKYSVTKDVDASLAYEYVNYNKSAIANSLNPEVIKLGVAYKF
jgi:opacity protein-like surface antigen